MTNPITSAILQSHSEQEREKKSRWNQREVGLSEEKKIFNVSDSWENAKIWMNLLHFYSFHSGIYWDRKYILQRNKEREKRQPPC